METTLIERTRWIDGVAALILDIKMEVALIMMPLISPIHLVENSLILIDLIRTSFLSLSSFVLFF